MFLLSNRIFNFRSCKGTVSAGYALSQLQSAGQYAHQRSYFPLMRADFFRWFTPMTIFSAPDLRYQRAITSPMLLISRAQHKKGDQRLAISFQPSVISP
ncbi:hypothetical protein [Niabella sp.]|uniref:hypothetical protein n=1 Tax=Niabella sp. TaxID=1962976 RepID=UPI002626BDC9|nr:hypothetical protein [Niabella sp.]